MPFANVVLSGDCPGRSAEPLGDLATRFSASWRASSGESLSS